MPPLKRCPILYEANKDIINAHLAEVLPPLLEKMEWNEGELILDHGCASGSTGFNYFAPLAEKNSSTVYALDICDELLGYARDNFSHSNVKYICGNLQSDPSPLAGLKFNKIFSLYTLNFIDKYQEELKTLFDLLVPGGDLFMVIVADSHLYDLYNNVKDHEKWGEVATEHVVIPQWRNHEHGHEKILKDAFTDAGFEIKEFLLEEKTHVFPKPSVFSDMVFGLNGSQKHLAPDDHDELRDAYRKFFTETETKYHQPNDKSADSQFTIHYDRADVLMKKPA